MTNNKIDALLTEMDEIFDRNSDRYQRGEPLAEQQRRGEIADTLNAHYREREALLTPLERNAQLALAKQILAMLESP